MISSRRKSCSACARGKRRCDLGFPECGRCLARRVTCVYAWIHPEEAQELVQSNNLSFWSPQEIRYDNYLDQNGPIETPQSNHRWHEPGESESHADVAALGPLLPLTTTPLTLFPALVPLLNEIIGRGRSISFLTPGPPFQSANTSSTNVGSVLFAPQPSHNTSVPATTLQIATDSPITTDSTFQARTEYAAGVLVQQVKTFAETGQTAFIHHTHVGTSPILRDTLAACSLHVLRNSVNRVLVQSEVTRRVELLVEATETAISLAPSHSYSIMGYALLPAVQALLAQAERDAVPLAKWVGILQRQAQWSRDSSAGDARLDLSGWRDWVQTESIRRTVVFAELLDGVYTFLRFGWDRAGARMAKLSFTGQVVLWEARSAAQWHQAMTQRPRFEVNISSFHDDIEAASPEDLDELGIIIRATYYGIDARLFYDVSSSPGFQTVKTAEFRASVTRSKRIRGHLKILANQWRIIGSLCSH
ncbi:hypothetical protein EDB81DRAFT_906556 [Dactylonectria macrodidyma]|uniref:Zn(2)-C6 fungal-type domain-containing protein n=1 Tax=Dactylonectria macrodidyma TaxID=307937 RepID=A0A9P9E008_9HYPO|nr:hypothetical protein EDB81DRAFT_906556 [Dactylonectria macrodidyma]